MSATLCRHRPGELARPTIYSDISRIHHHLNANPRDAYAWVDMARLYTSLGQFEKARQAINTARGIAPEDRFVLRAATRFFVHAGDAEIAERMLNGARATRHDPSRLRIMYIMSKLLFGA